MSTRGRPKRSQIPGLILEGMNSSSRNKCEFCHRVFNRPKGLRTHLLTHSDQKQYACSFANCTCCFKQSNQLKNHICLHTEEKPFICPQEGCSKRYRHSNRECSSHRGFKLINRPESAEVIRNKFYEKHSSEANRQWFEEYLSKRDRSRQSAVIKKRKRGDTESSQESDKDSILKSDSEVQSKNKIMKLSDQPSQEIVKSSDIVDDYAAAVKSGSGKENFKPAQEIVKRSNNVEDYVVAGILCSFWTRIAREEFSRALFEKRRALFEKRCQAVLREVKNVNKPD